MKLGKKISSNTIIDYNKEIFELIKIGSFNKLLRQFFLDSNYSNRVDDEKLKNFIDKIINKKEIHDQDIKSYFDFFSNDKNKYFFLVYLNYKKTRFNKENFNLLLQVLDYLSELKVNSDDLPNSIDLLVEGTKVKLKDILPRKLNDDLIKLVAKDIFPILEDTTYILKVYEDSFVDLSAGRLKNKLFKKVKDIDDNIFYLNNDSKKLKLSKGLVTKIFYTLDFGDYIAIKYENDNFEYDLEIINNVTGEVFSHGYNDVILKKYKNNLGEEREFIFLCTDEKIEEEGEFDSELSREEQLYTTDMGIISLYDLLGFFYPNNFINPDTKLLDKMEEVYIKRINNIYKYPGGYTYLDLSYQVKNHETFEINNYRHIFDGIIPMYHDLDRSTPIRYLSGFKDIEGFTFLSYGLVEKQTIDGYLDYNKKTIKIKDQPLFLLEEEKILGNITMYKINDNFYISKEDFKKELSNYQPYNDFVEIDFEEEFSYEGSTLSSIKGMVIDNKLIYYYKDKESNLIEIDEFNFMSYLEKENKTNIINSLRTIKKELLNTN